MRLSAAFRILILAGLPVFSFSQNFRISLLDSGKNTSLRGLCAVNEATLWVCGSNGSVAISTDSGKTFTWQRVPGYENRDFRDIAAFNDSTALIMAVAEPALILKTNNGGKSWKKVLEDTTKGMFLDAMDFADDRSGMVIGDPVDHHFFLGFTANGGDSWSVPAGLANSLIPENFPDEAFFAASGTNLCYYRSENAYSGVFVSGGSVSRIFYRNQIDLLPMNFGKETTGANSIAIDLLHHSGVVVGGDFAKDQDTTGNCVILYLLDSLRFLHPQTPPHGYRSCVAYFGYNKLITCGTSGVDISEDGGRNWQLISTLGFHVCQKSKYGQSVFLAGPHGRIAKLVSQDD